MGSVKRFVVWKWKSPREKDPKFHAALISNPDYTLCDRRAAGIMESDGIEYQIPPVKVNCITCQNRMKKYWPVRGAYYAD